jgi:FkbM family methyltransferase
MMTITTHNARIPGPTHTRRFRRVQRSLRHAWKRYVRWPAPIWRLQGYARLPLAGHEFTFYVEDVNVSWASKVWRGKWEREVTSYLKDVLRPGDVFFDVGAWTGPYVLLAAKLVQPGGWVHAFEPDPMARTLLERNVAANDASNITVVPCGVSDREGSAWLVAPRPGNSQSTIDNDHGAIEIQTVTLGGYCERQGAYPDVIKIDVEGAEAKVLTGGAEVLRRTRAIVLEVHDVQLTAAGVDPAVFRQAVNGLGKQVRVLQDRRDAGVVNLALFGAAEC